MGNVHQVAATGNFNPVDPIQAINTGGSTQIVGRNTGTVKISCRIPNGRARQRIARAVSLSQSNRDATAVTIAGMKGNGKELPG